MAITTIQVHEETLRKMKVRKCVLDFESYDELINYMLEFAPNKYVLASQRVKPDRKKLEKLFGE